MPPSGEGKKPDRGRYPAYQPAYVADPADFTQIRYDVDAAARTATVSLARPAQRNAISRRVSWELERAFDLAAADERVRVIILTGDGPHFSSGHDLGSKESMAEHREAFGEGVAKEKLGAARQLPDRWRWDLDSCLRMRECPKPTLSKVRGYCIYHAYSLATMACDICFAADDAQLMPTWAEHFDTPYKIGARAAKELLFQGPHFISGKEAARLGLVSRSVPAAELDAAVAQYCAIVARQDPHTLRMVKAVCDLADSQKGYEAYTKAALSMWVNMVGGLPPRKAGGPKSIIPRRARAAAKAKAKI